MIMFYVLKMKTLKNIYLKFLRQMFTCVENGLHTQGILQGSLQLKRVAGSMYQQALNTHHEMAQNAYLLPAMPMQCLKRMQMVI